MAERLLPDGSKLTTVRDSAPAQTCTTCAAVVPMDESRIIMVSAFEYQRATASSSHQIRMCLACILLLEDMLRIHIV